MFYKPDVSYQLQKFFLRCILLHREYEVRSLISTRTTLKWFIVVGIIILVIGVFIQWILDSFIGLIFLWAGIVIIGLSLVSLLYLWLSNRILPHPKY